MIDNYMYDIKHDEEFLIGENADQYHSFWWDDGEPLWITAIKQVTSDIGIYTTKSSLVLFLVYFLQYFVF